MKAFEKKGPNIFGIFFSAIFCIVLGVLIAVATLVTGEVVEVKAEQANPQQTPPTPPPPTPPNPKDPKAKEQPKDQKKPDEKLVIDKRKMYYFIGSDKESKDWDKKRDNLTSEMPGSYEFTESDINNWAKFVLNHPELRKKEKTKDKTKKKGEEPPEETKEPERTAVLYKNISLKISEVNFRMIMPPKDDKGAQQDPQFQIGGYLEVPQLLGGLKFIYQTRGTFKPQKDGVIAYTPDISYIGKCALPKVANFPEQVFDFLYTVYMQTDEYKQLSSYWRRLADVRMMVTDVKLTKKDAKKNPKAKEAPKEPEKEVILVVLKR